MFAVIYEFDVKAGMEEAFQAAWLELTQAIYRYCGSLGSRLHHSDDGQRFVAYAQWPSRAQWEQDHQIEAADYQQARQKMRATLEGVKTLYTLDTLEDYLQSKPASEV